MSKKKYTTGEKIKDITELISLINNKKSVYVNNKYQHYNFVVAMPLRHLLSAIDSGEVYTAKRLEV